jgi:hypothetical protein
MSQAGLDVRPPLLRSTQIILQAASDDNTNMQLESHLIRMTPDTGWRRNTGKCLCATATRSGKYMPISAQRTFAQRTL